MPRVAVQESLELHLRQAERYEGEHVGSEQEKFNVTGNEPSFNVKFDVKIVRMLSQRASVVKKGLGIWFSLHGSCILPNTRQSTSIVTSRTLALTFFCEARTEEGCLHVSSAR